MINTLVVIVTFFSSNNNNNDLWRYFNFQQCFDVYFRFNVFENFCKSVCEIIEIKILL